MKTAAVQLSMHKLHGFEDGIADDKEPDRLSVQYPLGMRRHAHSRHETTRRNGGAGYVRLRCFSHSRFSQWLNICVLGRLAWMEDFRSSRAAEVPGGLGAFRFGARRPSAPRDVEHLDALVIVIDVGEVIERLQHEMAGVVHDVTASVVMDALEKHLER
jgi:hypothetical protein